MVTYKLANCYYRPPTESVMNRNGAESDGSRVKDSNPEYLGRRTVLKAIGVGAATMALVPSGAGATQVDGPTVYVAGGSDNDDVGALHAIDPQTGEERWQWLPPKEDDPRAPSTYTSSPPTVSNGSIYLGINSERIFSVDAVSGEQEWESEQFSELSFGASSPTVIDGRVYTTTREKVLALDAADGELLWETEGEDWGVDPLVEDGRMYLVDFNGGVTCLDTVSGDVEWTHGDADGFQGRSLADGMLYVGIRISLSQGGVRALDANSGEVQWEVEMDGGFSRSSPTLFDGVVYIGDSDGNVHAIDTERREMLWTTHVTDGFEDDAPSLGAPTVYDDTVYIAGGEALFALDVDTGGEQWAFTDGVGRVAGTPTVANGTVYVSSNGSRTQTTARLYALDAGTGEEQWEFEPDRTEARRYDLLRGYPTIVDSPADGNGIGTRSTQAIHGHTELFSEDAGDELAGESGSPSGNGGGDGSSTNTDESLPGFGIPAAAAGVSGVAYALKRRRESADSK